MRSVNNMCSAGTEAFAVILKYCMLLLAGLYSTPTLVVHFVHIHRDFSSSFPCTVYAHRPLVFHQRSVSDHFTAVNTLNSAATLGCLKFPGTLLFLIYSYLRHSCSTSSMVVWLLYWIIAVVPRQTLFDILLIYLDIAVKAFTNKMANVFVRSCPEWILHYYITPNVCKPFIIFSPCFVHNFWGANTHFGIHKGSVNILQQVKTNGSSLAYGSDLRHVCIKHPAHCHFS